MTIQEFEKIIKTKYRKEFNVRENPRNSELAHVFFGDNLDSPLFTIPAKGIQEAANPYYGILTASGTFIRHPTISESLQKAEVIAHKLKTDIDYMDALLGKGEYSDDNLK